MKSTTLILGVLLFFAAYSGAQVEVEAQGKLLDIDFKEIPLVSALRELAKQGKLNIFIDDVVTGNITVHLEHIPVEEALQQIIRAKGLAFYKTKDYIYISTKEKLKEVVGVVTDVIRLNYIEAEDAKTMVSGLATAAQNVQVNKTNNQLIITETVENLQKIKEVINKLDIPPQQVMLEVRVYEVSYDVMRKLGLDWGESTSITITEEEPPAGEIALQSFTREAIELSATLYHLVSEGKANILANPRIATQHNKEASILIGDKVPYTMIMPYGYGAGLGMGTAGGISGLGGELGAGMSRSPNRQITSEPTRQAQPEYPGLYPGGAMPISQYVAIGINLGITPQINPEGYITVKVKPEVSTLKGWGGLYNQMPWIGTRELETNLRVKDGETIILGGLLSTEERESLSRVPGLSELPILGGLFRSKRKDIIKTEIIITITPRILTETIIKDVEINEPSIDQLLEKTELTPNVVTHKSGPPIAKPGEEITFTIIYKNIGNGPAYEVEIIDKVPEYTTFVLASPGGKLLEDGTVSWQVGAVPPGIGGEVWFRVKVNPELPPGTIIK